MRTPAVTSPANGGLGLMQERLRNDPWALLVGCILYARVRGATAWPILCAILRRWPRPASLAAQWLMAHELMAPDPRDELEDILRPLGFQRRRAEAVWRMTMGYLRIRPHLRDAADVTELYGLGRYAADSWQIFVRGRIVGTPEDKELRAYVRWARHRSAPKDRRAQKKRGTDVQPRLREETP